MRDPNIEDPYYKDPNSIGTSGPNYINMCGCQNYGTFLGPYYDMAPNIQGTQKGTLILTTTHTGT